MLREGQSFSGFDTSQKRLDFDDRRGHLQAFIRDMVREAPSWSGEIAKASVGSAQTAIAFLAALPSNRALPLVAADDEGDVLFVWRPPTGDCILTIEEGTLHLVVRPGGVEVDYVDSVPFTGVHIPLSILQNLPMR